MCTMLKHGSREVPEPGIFAQDTVGPTARPFRRFLGMRRLGTTLRTWAVVSAAALLLAGCMVAAAGAGAGGGIYFTQRGVESVVPATVDRAAAATATAFDQLKVRQTKSQAERGGEGGKGETGGRAGA